jgi:hypothetical protein
MVGRLPSFSAPPTSCLPRLRCISPELARFGRRAFPRQCLVVGLKLTPRRTTAQPLVTHSGHCHPSLNHLVGGGEQRFGNGEAECFGSVKVEDQFIPRRQLHRQVTWLFSSENAVDVRCGTTEQVDLICPVGRQCAVFNMVAVRTDTRQPMPQGELAIGPN